jgi:hypothetical protein
VVTTWEQLHWTLKWQPQETGTKSLLLFSKSFRHQKTIEVMKNQTPKVNEVLKGQ